MLRVVRFVTLVLAALVLTMPAAHVLELPQKLQYDATMYASVNTTLYRQFAVTGGPLTAAAILASLVLCVLVRRRAATRAWTFAGAACLVFGLSVWLAVVNPVNLEIARALRTAPGAVPDLWMRLRTRWEGGHAVGFLIDLAAFGALVVSVLIDTPRRASEPLAARAPYWREDASTHAGAEPALPQRA